uniref:DUF8040 domain-containing protein n=1 Tax=Nelumbo nucifera TaxID=4432 RepID=A0A822YBK7_NELNU|nr:TPA_asm: hypothetical protein HUJ06_030369 [Nelumbo nucifera]
MKDSRYVLANEYIGIILQIIRQNKSNQDTIDRFQHSSETISQHFNTALKVICEFGKEIAQPGDLRIAQQHIFNNPKYYPWFKITHSMCGVFSYSIYHQKNSSFEFFFSMRNCVSAIDGTHVHAYVLVSEKVPFRG